MQKQSPEGTQKHINEQQIERFFHIDGQLMQLL